MLSATDFLRQFTPAGRLALPGGTLYANATPFRSPNAALFATPVPPPAAAAAATPRGPDDVRVAAVMDILSRNFDKIDAAQALALLPPDMPLAAVAPFLQATLRHAGDAARTLAVTRQLAVLRHVKTHDALVTRQARAVTLDRGSACPVCSRRLAVGGAHGVFAVYPNGVTVHYACVQRLDVCPVTGTGFTTAGSGEASASASGRSGASAPPAGARGSEARKPAGAAGRRSSKADGDSRAQGASAGAGGGREPEEVDLGW
jgi:hypothetical protein